MVVFVGKAGVGVAAVVVVAAIPSVSAISKTCNTTNFKRKPPKHN